MIAATNRPFDIDSAILRRFHKHIHVGLPDVRERRELIQAQFCASSDTHCVSNDEIQVIAMKSEGYSGSDIAKVCNEAKLIPVRELLKNFEKSGIHPCASERRPVSIEDLKSALNSVPSTSSYKKYFLKGDD